eukprot:TRINITY_DN4579_c0_g1_i1.p1 TRINITY_DN4579_c0_g1~~TRINITY_DN4579_c0_g1_i1.p1  ORF type:complete len:282 (-),score=51.67 TRINITY_DN4579_c0_g1_i1:183-1028(-)
MTVFRGIRATMSELKQNVVFFDLGGVILDVSPIDALRHIGTMKFVASILTCAQSPTGVKKELFDFLHEHHPTDHSHGSAEGDTRACSEDVLLPGVLCEWLQGSRTNAQLSSSVDDVFEENGWQLGSGLKQDLLRSMCMFLLDPVKFAESVSVLSAGVDIVRECRKKVDPTTGKPLNRLFVSSNWDRESFQRLRTRPDLVDLWSNFDGFIVSGEVSTMKPYQEFYDKMLSTAEVTDPTKTRCVFIDDQEENITAGNKAGMFSLHCKDHSNVRQQLKELGVID